MKITLLLIGKTNDDYLKKGIGIYQDRLKNYITFELKTIPELKKTKSLSELQQKEQEGLLILELLKPQDTVLLLDEHGEEYSSVNFSTFLQKKMLSGIKNLIFVIGGPYGFSDKVYQRANGKISLSKMTFSHQMIRLIFIEQLYRAFTILKGEPYHHE
ncbi:MAG: 23S rRNA (pseudouridine(1915)-N(3))-methyltransferase RlmH [Bacteroidota bacterium]|nr:23S rRNA (pseudouridine(1915)-N(3))-methyltransferase RlmH [Bacteroidota bacterium]MDP4275204.1 23S rRNA (pseudouridine(1915)-N(3))-methyltransferase RlmH [Bacteroidota bacterium]